MNPKLSYIYTLTVGRVLHSKNKFVILTTEWLPRYSQAVVMKVH